METELDKELLEKAKLELVRPFGEVLAKTGLVQNDGSNWKLIPRPEVKGLEKLYRKLYRTIPWLEPMPPPDRVLFKWNSRFESTLGACWPLRDLNIMVIEINSVYQDKRLKEELEPLLIHEAAHFTWPNHNKEFKAFLRIIGVPDGYIGGSSPWTEPFQTVLLERKFPVSRAVIYKEKNYGLSE